MDDFELKNMAASACQEALSFGVGEDVFLRLARSVHAKCAAENLVLTNALWKACGDDEDVVNATIESQRG